ncbi:hypothetical protein [Brevundimonas sp. PAMC22021]|uniref:hypothetical protein n=1 Tax=Brevundimonas sp. PAMC22021 TaxID=2861285 RepID=UPI001C6360BA|nr:hypothetical protein [Brevundimonas sp. PAMC22021]QYF87139.1 hypothetical protein KY493_01045 [Brevundimonas sp. PAMC22021]
MTDDNRTVEGLARERGTRFRWGLGLVAVSGAAVVGGAVVGLRTGGEGDVATAAGAAVGLGLVALLGGAALAWCARPGRPLVPPTDGQETRRDRLQRARTQQLVIFPFVMLAFMMQSHRGMQAVLAGQGDLGAYLQVSLPVIYGWLVPAIVMGWDWNTRQHRRFLDDELTQAMRAQAMMLAFAVLMAGVTVAMVLGMWRPAVGVAALPYVLAIGGATAGLRFAWLDREAERNG